MVNDVYLELIVLNTQDKIRIKPKNRYSVSVFDFVDWLKYHVILSFFYLGNHIFFMIIIYEL